ncbi:PucR family transcriptional regulator [Streptomyces sp. TLI_171]|uniref:PucR family transcriptional regulator n=1 Tax=Streptomyces sp. TLI_171 TaxID=1938859 RepID=UPI000C1A067B|nr:PucR family transcriptional regulator [Streptomyces sp. TLI_171]RKE23700.1 purine catabolism regulator [Streptomyces sp. TLI_171]
MPLTVRDLLAIPALRLTLAAGNAGLGRTVEAAHASEATDPSAWLEGGEVVMTTGLLLGAAPDDLAAFIADLDRAGAAALVLGLGPSLPHQQVPPALARAADRHGLPLITVPERTSPAAVTKAVFDARSAEERRLLERTLRTQRRLTAAAASPDGLTDLLTAWYRATGVAVVVCDVLTRALGAAGADAAEVLAGAATILDSVALRGLRGSGGGELPGGPVHAQPLGAARLRGFVVLVGASTAETRLLGSVLVSLLSVELERRHLAEEPRRRHRTTVLSRLFAADLSASRATALLSSVNLSAGPLRALAVHVAARADPPPGTGRPSEAAETAADLALAIPGGLARAVGTTVEAVVPEGTDALALLARFAPGRPAGIGPAVAPQHAALSLRQAHALLPASTQAGRPVTAAEAGSVRLLLSLGSPALLAAFADTALAALDAADPDHELTETLRVWLETNGSWAETSALLGLHRHTVQNRIAKIGRLTGRRMDRAEDRIDLWLALRAREAAGF